MSGEHTHAVPLRGWRLWAGRAFVLSLLLIILGSLFHIFKEPLSGRAHWRRQGAVFETDENDDYVAAEMKGPQFTNDAVACLLWTPRIKEVILERSSITDAAGDSLQQLQYLERLDLSHTNISDLVFQELILPELTWLDISETAITDQTLRQLAQFPKLRMLNLSGTGVTDTGLANLAGCPALVSVNLRECRQVTNRGLVALCSNNTMLGLGYEFSSLDSLTDQEVRDIPGAAHFWSELQPPPPENYSYLSAPFTVIVDRPEELRSLVRPKVIDTLKIVLGYRRSHVAQNAICDDFRRELSTFRSELKPECQILAVYAGPLCDGYVRLLSELPIGSESLLDLWEVSGRLGEPNISPEPLRRLAHAQKTIPEIYLDHPTPDQLEVVLQFQIVGLSISGDFSDCLSLERLSGQRQLVSLTLSDEFITSLDLTPLIGLPALKFLYIYCPQLERKDIVGWEKFPDHTSWHLRPSPTVDHPVSRPIDATGLME